MSDSGYTASMGGTITTDDVRWAVILKMEGFWHPDAAGDFDRWLAAHDAAIREDQAKKDIAIVEKLYPLGSEVLGNAPTVIAAALRSQSFTGTESEGC